MWLKNSDHLRFRNFLTHLLLFRPSSSLSFCLTKTKFENPCFFFNLYFLSFSLYQWSFQGYGHSLKAATMGDMLDFLPPPHPTQKQTNYYGNDSSRFPLQCQLLIIYYFRTGYANSSCRSAKLGGYPWAHRLNEYFITFQTALPSLPVQHLLNTCLELMRSSQTSGDHYQELGSAVPLGKNEKCWRKRNEGTVRSDDICFSEFSKLFHIFWILSKRHLRRQENISMTY